MKTSKYWQSQSPKTVYDQDKEQWIKQIQLDAMKEGKLRAANIVEHNLGAWTTTKTKQAILTAAEQLTEKDL